MQINRHYQGPMTQLMPPLLLKSTDFHICWRSMILHILISILLGNIGYLCVHRSSVFEGEGNLLHFYSSLSASMFVWKGQMHEYLFNWTPSLGLEGSYKIGSVRPSVCSSFRLSVSFLRIGP